MPSPTPDPGSPFRSRASRATRAALAAAALLTACSTPEDRPAEGATFRATELARYEAPLRCDERSSPSPRLPHSITYYATRGKELWQAIHRGTNVSRRLDFPSSTTLPSAAEAPAQRRQDLPSPAGGFATVLIEPEMGSCHVGLAQVDTAGTVIGRLTNESSVPAEWRIGDAGTAADFLRLEPREVVYWVVERAGTTPRSYFVRIDTVTNTVDLGRVRSFALCGAEEVHASSRARIQVCHHRVTPARLDSISRGLVREFPRHPWVSCPEGCCISGS